MSTYLEVHFDLSGLITNASKQSAQSYENGFPPPPPEIEREPSILNVVINDKA